MYTFNPDAVGGARTANSRICLPYSHTDPAHLTHSVRLNLTPSKSIARRSTENEQRTSWCLTYWSLCRWLGDVVSTYTCFGGGQITSALHLKIEITKNETRSDKRDVLKITVWHTCWAPEASRVGSGYSQGLRGPPLVISRPPEKKNCSQYIQKFNHFKCLQKTNVTFVF